MQPHVAPRPQPKEPEQVAVLRLFEEGAFPNNPALPALVYHRAFDFADVADPAAHVERVFARHGWFNGWRDGVYDFHHFHSTAHEVLGCYRGRAKLQLGGPGGPTLELSSGDVLVLPAGVSHRRIEGSPDFAVVGAYAAGTDWDMSCGDPDERAEADARIARVALPAADPVHGASGPLLEHWR